MDPLTIGMLGAGIASQVGGSLLKNRDDGAAARSDMWTQLGAQARARVEQAQQRTDEINRNAKVWEPGGPYDQERARQAGYQSTADAVTGRQIGRYDNLGGQIDTRAHSIADFLTSHSSGVPAGVMPASRSAVTNADTATKLGRAAEYNTQQNGALSKMRSFGDLWADTDRSQLGDRQDLANVSNFRQAVAGQLPFSVEVAKGPAPVPQIPLDTFSPHVGQPNNTFSDLLMGAGKIATSAGLSGFDPFGGGFTGTPAGLDTYGSPGYARNPLDLRVRGQT